MSSTEKAEMLGMTPEERAQKAFIFDEYYLLESINGEICLSVWDN